MKNCTTLALISSYPDKALRVTDKGDMRYSVVYTSPFTVEWHLPFIELHLHRTGILVELYLWWL